jgi:hypothetical protein
MAKGDGVAKKDPCRLVRRVNQIRQPRGTIPEQISCFVRPLANLVHLPHKVAGVPFKLKS